MAKPIVMPQVGQDLVEGELVEWNVKVGDSVKKGDMLAVVESEKASFEVEAYEEGIVLKLLYQPGEMATVLQPLLILGDVGETLDEEIAQPAETQTNASNQRTDSSAEIKPSVEHNPGETRSSPLARRMAALNNLDITQIRGSGPKRAVVKKDIEAALANTVAPPPSVQAAASQQVAASISGQDIEQPFNKMRQVIANRLLESKQTIPHFYLMADADVSDLQVRRAAHFELTGEKLSLNDIIVHATALTLQEYPRLNSYVSNTGIVQKAHINIGVAVSVEDGLMVPAIEDTPSKSPGEISTLIRDYANAARRGFDRSKVRSTFSISNLGMYGVEVLPIINLPEAGILGVGPVNRVVKEVNGGLHVRDVLRFSLAADHRAVDGAYGAQFLKSLTQSLEIYNHFA